MGLILVVLQSKSLSRLGGGSAEVVWRYDGKLESVNFLTATDRQGYIVSSHIKKVANIIEKLEDLLPRFS